MSLEQRVEDLALPPRIRKDLVLFCGQLQALYGQDLVNLTVFGSAAGGTYREKTSDLNLLVVYSDLNIADLTIVAKLARIWLRRRRFAPRFLSRRNLADAAVLFPLDTLDMQDRHVVLFGEDLVGSLAIDRRALAWQVSTELKAMRLRVKQQFWRTTGHPARMAALVAQRYAALLVLARGILILENLPAGKTPGETQEALARRFAFRPGLLEGLAQIQAGEARPRRQAAIQSFTDLMDVIRALDDRAGELRG